MHGGRHDIGFVLYGDDITRKFYLHYSLAFYRCFCPKRGETPSKGLAISLRSLFSLAPSIDLWMGNQNPTPGWARGAPGMWLMLCSSRP